MISEDELLQILDRISNNTATDDDLRMYNLWCNAQQQPAENKVFLSFEEDRALQEINSRIDGQKSRFSWLEIAAAVVLLVCVPVFYTSIRQTTNTEKKNNSAAVHQDIPRGTNSATLTLADGRKMMLTGGNKRLLAGKDERVLISQNDSAVIYEYKGGAAASTLRNNQNILATVKAQEFQLVLADGTKVWLNASTTLKYPADFESYNERTVEIEGEAYFEVAKNPKKPFIVHSSGQHIRVLGTHFNIRNYPNESNAKTTLLEGAVTINGKSKLRPGQQAIVDKKGTVTIAKANINASVAWQKGFFEFADKDIYAIMKDISNWYDVDVIYEGEIPSDNMNGTISKYENVSAVLGIMEAIGVFKFRIEDKKIYVRKA